MKNIVNKPKLGAGLTALAFSLMASVNVWAQFCTVPPTCNELGYDKTENDCSGISYLKCPFDRTKYYCLTENDIKILGGGDNKDTELEDSDNNSTTACVVGAILYSDKTCSAELINTKTPIGVVAVVKPEINIRLAIALKDTNVVWSTELFDIPDLRNYTSNDEAKLDWNGKGNTQIIINYCKENNKICPAAEYANNYRTDGTNAGDWYLPAYGEYKGIHETLDAWHTIEKLVGNNSYHSWQWTSTEYSDKEVYPRINNGAPSYSYHPKTVSDDKRWTAFYVRPVLAF